MKKIITVISVLLLAASVSLAEEKKDNSPSAGDWAIGVNINPVAAGGMKYQPSKGEFVGDFLGTYFGNPSQMYIPSQSLVSIKVKNMLSSSLAFKATLGFGGSHIDYTEYVADDYARALDSASEAVVSDNILGNLGSASLTAGLQKMLGKGNLKFSVGADLAYTIAWGKLDFRYGNDFETYNGFKPSSMALTLMGSGEMNRYTDPKLGIAYARPYSRNEIGTIQQIGLIINAGLEYFLAEKISVGAEVALLPVAFTWQSQTWGQYQGYSSNTMTVLTYNKLVSDGSHAMTYGLNNFGVNLSFNYYF